jgi:hypothetical protein
MLFGRINKTALFAVLCVMVVVPSALFSTTMIEFTNEDLAVESDIILQGKVMSTWTEFGDNGRYIYTYGTVAVDKVVKGYIDGNQYTIKIPGGTIGSSMMIVHGTAEFSVGDELLLFLVDDESFESNVLGWHQGRFNIVDGVVVQNGETVNNFIREIESHIIDVR